MALLPPQAAAWLPEAHDRFEPAVPGVLGMGDNGVVIVPRAIAQESRFAAAVAGIEQQLHPAVVRLRYTLGNDWTGDPAVFFRIILSDDASQRDRLLNAANGISAAIVQRIEPLEQWGVLPYFSFRSQSEQAHLNEPAWA
jgi:hypothetical protein